MRAAILVDGDLAIEERPTPEPGGDQVLVEVTAAGLNRADLLQKMGAYPAPPGWPTDVCGLEFSGTVVATGSQVASLDAGDAVFGIAGGGAHATHLLVPASLCVPLPQGLDAVVAGGAPEIFVTAHDALVTIADLRPQERCLIHGIGSGVGTAALQVAKALGATTIGTSRTEAKLERARALGLDRGVVASSGAWKEMAADVGEVDVVIDLVGGDYLRTDVEVCATYGRIVIVGLLAGARSELDMGLVLRKRLTIRGTTLRARPDYLKAQAVAAFGREVAPGLANGLFQVVVDRTYELSDIAAAYEHMAANGGFGKIIVTMDA